MEKGEMKLHMFWADIHIKTCPRRYEFNSSGNFFLYGEWKLQPENIETSLQEFQRSHSDIMKATSVRLEGKRIDNF